MKRQLKKQVIPTIACTSILLTSFALGHEFIISSIEPTISKVPSKEKVLADPAITMITKEILTPVRLQEQRRHNFSRSMPTRSNSYELVEISSDQAEGARYFDILIFTEPMKIFTLQSANIGQATKQPKPKPVATPTVYLKLKYLTASNKVLIQQNHEWVERSKHKYLSLIPVITK
jgi:hypothetical protein